MNAYLGIERERLAAETSLWTAQEIALQPQLWDDAAATVQRRRAEIDEWLRPYLEDPRLRIILCGAGSSSFVGQTLAPWLSGQLRRRVEAVATTDLVGRPDAYLAEDVPTLMISFSRSGGSPESAASIDLGSQLLGECRHLVLTCNPEGDLARFATGNPDMLCLQLPDQACDRGFAMTGGYTSMQVSCAGIFAPDPEQLDGAIRSGRFVVENLAARARALAKGAFERLVVLGAGCLRATAREASLKVLELTNGGVVPLSDTPLGFRHGPKCIVNRGTCIVLLASAAPYTARYDLDLLREICADGRAGMIVVLHGDHRRAGRGAKGARPAHPITPDVLARLRESGRTEIVSVAGEDGNRLATGIDDFWLSLPYLVFCQMLAFFKARELGVPVDNPCPSGEVNRVVQGVTIHPYAG